MLGRIGAWETPLKLQDLAVFAFLAVLVALLILMAFNRRLRDRIQRPAKPIVIGLAFLVLLALTLIALMWG